ncbi:hypothetical protein LINPERPRIM_LOCUS38822 [Linum perenne]
MRTNQKVTNP